MASLAGIHTSIHLSLSLNPRLRLDQIIIFCPSYLGMTKRRSVYRPTNWRTDNVTRWVGLSRLKKWRLQEGAYIPSPETWDARLNPNFPGHISFMRSEVQIQMFVAYGAGLALLRVREGGMKCQGNVHLCIRSSTRTSTAPYFVYSRYILWS